MHHNSTITTFMLIIFFILFKPIFSPPQNPLFKSKVIYAVKISFFLSLYPITLFFNEGLENITMAINCLKTPNFNLYISFKFDIYALLFSTVAFYVTWAILEFAKWYMVPHLKSNQFFKYMLIFLITMLILVTANNMFQIFLGWEGVGIMSFLLISWWYGRADTNTAALQAVIYNRVGDIGLILTLIWMATNINSWELHNLFMHSKSFNLSLPLFGVILAATGKSAQFSLHPWLPSAMEGPTPISALLHSSTMVVAGIFLLIRFSPMLESNINALTTCLCLGSMTALFTATCALTQNDIKKIVALSTSSQLGLMMVTVGLNQPHLAFLHICLHAFFKAMLFLCSGSLIHALNNEQDLRKMGNMSQMTPLTSTCFIIGSFSLTGMPFLTGFFSKDAILEAMNTSYLNTWALVVTLLATMFTPIYNMRIMYYALMNHPRFTSMILNNENSPLLINPLKRLAWGSMFAGLLITLNIPPYKTPIMSMTFLTKVSTIALVIIGLLLALEMASLNSEQHKSTPTLSLHNFSNMAGYFPTVIHSLTTKLSLIFAQNMATHMIDQIWLEKTGPKMIVSFNMPLINATNNFQQGNIKNYLNLFLFTMTIFLMMTYCMV